MKSANHQFKYWDSRLFNDVYLKRDLPAQEAHIWEADEEEGFQYLMNDLRNLAKDYGDEDSEQSSWSETETINKWIKPVLRALGWEDDCRKYSQSPYVEEASLTHGDMRYKPDIMIVDLPEEAKYIRTEKGTKKLQEAKKSVLVPVEAKYWNRLEEDRQGHAEEKKKNHVGSDSISKTMSPNGQIVQYMRVLDKDWGILTDGAYWRLFNKEASGEDINRYYEFDLSSLVRSLATEENEDDTNEAVEAAKYFYFFFSKKAIAPKDGEPLVSKFLDYSKKYINKVEYDLKERFMQAMNIACNAFYVKSRVDDTKIIRNVAESALFNILFIRSLESRNILPMNAPDYRKISLSAIIDKIEHFDPNKECAINRRNLERDFSNSNGDFSYSTTGNQLHDRMVRLTKIIHGGRSKNNDFGFEIQGFRQSVFSLDEWKFFRETKLQNSVWVEILFQIGYAKSDAEIRDYQQVPYSYFTPRQVGSIYESFLEFKLEKADQSMAFKNGCWKKADLDSRKYRAVDLPKVRSGELFFAPDNRDRKVTGSYYTPEHIVQHIVKETIKTHIKNKPSEKVLEVKVCDPAMGSGHFLLGALRYLTEAFLIALDNETAGDLTITHSEAKRKVLGRCIFGVDINPSAVKLAKMSLWLDSAHINKKLKCLDDQIKVGDSLIDFSWKNEFSEVFSYGGFSCIIQNPPYVFARDKKIDNKDKVLFKQKFKWSTYQSNTYTMFLEKSFDLLKDGGSLGAIIPNNWMTIDTCRTFRQGYLSNFNRHRIVNSRDKVFKDAAVDISIILAEKTNTQGQHTTVDLYELAGGKFSHKKTQKIKEDTGDPIIYSVGSESIDEVEFIVMEKCSKLGELVEVRSGFKAYEIGKGTPLQTNEIKNKRTYHSTSRIDSTFRPYLNGEDVCRYYTKKPSEFIKYGKNLAAPRKKELYEGVRILVRQIVSKLPYSINAVVIDNDYMNDLNSMIVPVPKLDEAYFLAAVLNSKITSAWFDKKFGKIQRKTFPQFKVKELKEFPIPDVDTGARKSIAKLSEKIHRLSSEGKCDEASKVDEQIEERVRAGFFDKESIKEIA